MNSVEIGKAFEKKARKFLREKGFKILEHSSKKKWSSPYDFIVSKNRRKFFVEVRSSKNAFFLISRKKLKTLKKLGKNVLFCCIVKEKDVLFNIKKIKKDFSPLRINGVNFYVCQPKKKGLIMPLTLEIEKGLWEKFKATVPRTKTLSEAICELIKKEVEK